MKFLLATLPLIAIAGPAFAEAATPAASADPVLCTDRPTKSNAACTVPAGSVQIESDLANWTVTSAGGVRSDVVLYTNPTVKLGLSDSNDLEVNWAPYVTARTRAGAVHDTIDGVGDVYVRFKQRLTPADAKVLVAIIPFIKAPTAPVGIGNGKWEGGAALPVNIALPQSFTLTFSPEVDLLEDSDGRGKHAQAIGTINLAKPLTPALVAYAELWTAQNYDPRGTVRQYSIDGAIAYALTPRLQFDAGANLGLNRFTPDAQLYVGISTRF